MCIYILYIHVYIYVYICIHIYTCIYIYIYRGRERASERGGGEFLRRRHAGRVPSATTPFSGANTPFSKVLCSPK